MARKIPAKTRHPVRRGQQKVIARPGAGSDDLDVDAAVDQVKAALATVEAQVRGRKNERGELLQ